MIKRLIARMRDDSGVTAMIVAVAGVALIGAASLAIDISRFTYQRELTRDAIEAGAQAGSFYLPENPTAALAAAEAAAKYVDAEADPTAKLLCVVPYSSVLGTYDSSTVSQYCTPGPYTTVGSTNYYSQSLYPDKKCSATYGICTLPCTLPCQVDRSVNPATVTAGYTFNAISITMSSTVQYLFGPIMDQFSKTFDASAHMIAACKGVACVDTSNTTPMNIVIVLDRTGSVSDADRRAMVKSIEGMFSLMDPKIQFVALAPMGKSVTSGGCLTAPATQAQIQATSGNVTKWVSVPYSWNYLNANRTLNTASDIVAKALGQGNTSGDVCLSATQSNNPGGSFLAASLKGAARYLLDTANLTGAPARAGAVQNVIFFESDGEPYEPYDMPGSSSTSLDDSKEVWFKETSYTNGQNVTQCANLKAVAENAKAKGITIFSVAFGADGTNCGSGDAVAAMAAIAGKYITKSDGSVVKEVSTPNYLQTSSQVWDSNLTYQGQINCPATSSTDPKYATCWTTTKTWNTNNTYASTSSCSGVSSGSRNQTDYPSCYSLQPQWDATNTFAGTVDCGDVTSSARNQTDYPSCYKDVSTWNVGGSVTYSGTVDCADIKSSAYSQSTYPDCYKRGTTFNTSTTYSGTVDCVDIKSTAYSKSRYPSCYSWKAGATFSTSNSMSCADIAASARGTKSNTNYSTCWGSSSWSTSKTYTGTVRCDDISSGARGALTGTYASCYQWDTALSNTGTVRCTDLSSSAQSNYPSCYDLVWDTTKSQTGTVRCADISTSAQSSYPNCYSDVPTWDTTKFQTGTISCADISNNQSSYSLCYDQVMSWNTSLTYPVQKDCPTNSNNSATYDSCWDTTTTWSSSNKYTGPVSCSTVSSGNRSQSNYPTCYSTVWTNTTNCDPAVENSDGDRFFCAASGSDFLSIFKTAFLQLYRNSKFIRLP